MTAPHDPTHCLTGHFHTTGGTGKDTVIGGVPAYVVLSLADSASSPSLLICTDIFGHTLPNARIVADKFAAAGFNVYVPDLMSGDAISPEGFDRATFGAWREKHGDAATVPIVEAVVADLKASHGVTTLFAIGFCWGARWAVLLAQDAGKVAGFGIGHPSFVSTTDLAAVGVPGIFLLAEVDSAFPAEAVAAAKAALVAEKPTLTFEWRGPYPGTTHGFCVRGSESDKAVVEARADALDGAAAFFHRVAANQQ